MKRTENDPPPIPDRWSEGERQRLIGDSDAIGRGLPVSVHALKLPERIGCLHSGDGAPAPREIGNIAR